MKQFTLILSALFALTLNYSVAQTGVCMGSGTEADEGTFTTGYDYTIETNGTDVTITYTLLDADIVGLVAFAQVLNPGFAEIPMNLVDGQTYTTTLTNQTPGNTFSVRCKFAFAGGLATTTYIEYIVDEGCAAPPNPTECAGNDTAADEGEFTTGYNYSIITEGTDVILTYELLDADIVGLVAFAQVLNPDFSETPMNLVEGQTYTATISNQTPGATISVRAKFAFAGGLATTTYVNYVVGEGCAAPTPEIDLPITFEDPGLDYGIRDFDGTTSTIVADPVDGANTVVQTIKAADAAFFAGTVIADAVGMINPIPFSEGNTTMSVRVWAPVAPVQLRMKVENNVSPGTNVETAATLETAGEWATVVFDFANNVDGSPALNVDADYNMLVMFFDFGNAVLDQTMEAQTYFFDDIEFGGDPGGGPQVDLPITFDDPNIDYGLIDFDGTGSNIVVDPDDANNRYVETNRAGDAAFFAGTVVAANVGFVNPIPFSEGNTTMSMRVWSPVAPIALRMKVENVDNPPTNVETQTVLTTANEWTTVVFDFANNVVGSPALDVNADYNLAVVFFDFGNAAGGGVEQVYRWDDITFGGDFTPYTVVDVIQNSPDHTTLASVLEEAELVETLNGQGWFTVFAPTNDAFSALTQEQLDALLADPTGDLQQILLYHVLPANLFAGDLTTGPQVTAQGEECQITVSGEMVMVDDANVTVPNLTANNGVVHVIDQVILPDAVSLVGLEEISANSGIEVWPNPSTELININFVNGIVPGTIVSIYDVAGKVVFQTNINDVLTQVNVTSYPAGHYIIRIDTPEAGYYKKMVVTR
jgi:hypothetical protein